MARSKKKKALRTKRSRREDSFMRQIAKGLLRIIALVLVFVCIYFTTRLEWFTIQDLTFTGGKTISHETLYQLVDSELEGTYFRLVPKRFSYLLPQERIVQVIENFPRVHNVEISREGRVNLHISFQEYIPHALWCVEDSSTTPCFFLDQTGEAFVEAPVLQGGSFVRHFTRQQNFKEGKVLDEDLLSDIDSFIVDAQQALGFRINAVHHMSDKDYSFEVNGGGIILVSLNRELSDTLENVVAVLESDEFSHIAPGNFQYIDARFENKIFINENIIEDTATSSDGTTEEETEVLPE